VVLVRLGAVEVIVVADRADASGARDAEGAARRARVVEVHLSTGRGGDPGEPEHREAAGHGPVRGCALKHERPGQVRERGLAARHPVLRQAQGRADRPPVVGEERLAGDDVHGGTRALQRRHRLLEIVLRVTVLQRDEENLPGTGSLRQGLGRRSHDRVDVSDRGVGLLDDLVHEPRDVREVVRRLKTHPRVVEHTDRRVPEPAPVAADHAAERALEAGLLKRSRRIDDQGEGPTLRGRAAARRHAEVEDAVERAVPLGDLRGVDEFFREGGGGRRERQEEGKDPSPHPFESTRLPQDGKREAVGDNRAGRRL
jgi:hypothetical protein